MIAVAPEGLPIASVPTASAYTTAEYNNGNYASTTATTLSHELWRRALLTGDERAWQVLYHEYNRQVGAWVKAQLRFAVDTTTMQTLIDDAFVKMAGTFRRHPEKFADYPNLAALLGLLRLCAQRVVQDYGAAAQQTVPVISLDAIDEPRLDATAPPSDLWGQLEGLLQDEKEWLVVTKLLIEEAKPRHLYAEQPHLFASVDEINTIRERVKGRLQRNDTFRHHWQAMLHR